MTAITPPFAPHSQSYAPFRGHTFCSSIDSSQPELCSLPRTYLLFIHRILTARAMLPSEDIPSVHPSIHHSQSYAPNTTMGLTLQFTLRPGLVSGLHHDCTFLPHCIVTCLPNHPLFCLSTATICACMLTAFTSHPHRHMPPACSRHSTLHPPPPHRYMPPACSRHRLSLV